MAKFNIDLSGRKGLAPQHQGHIDGSTPVPQYSYLGSEGQLADGTYNPFYRYGYIAPANDVFTALTGTISDRITSTVFDEVNDDLYFGTDGPNILRLDGLDDTSLTTDTTIDSDRNILDMELYEVAGKRALVYVTDSSDIGDGMSIGFKGLYTDSGMIVFDLPVITENLQHTYETIGNSSTVEKIAQRLYGDDTQFQYGKTDRIRVRLSRLGAGTSYTIKVGIQKGSSLRPDGTFIAYGTVDPSTIQQITDTDVNGQDVYVDLDTVVTFDSTNYWVVVEPTVIGEMIGTNSFVWYRTDGNNEIYPNTTGLTSTIDGGAYDYISSTWASADTQTNETFDCSLLLSEIENWFPVKDRGQFTYTEIAAGLAGVTGTNVYFSVLKYDATHVVVAWEGTDSDGFIQIFAVNVALGTITAVGSPLEFETVQLTNVAICLYDSTHIAVVWGDGDLDGRAQIVAVDANYACTAVGSSLEFDAAQAVNIDVVLLDSTHLAVVWENVDGDGQIKCLAVDGSYAVTAVGTQLEFEDDDIDRMCIVKIDSTHVFVAWNGPSNHGYARILTVNGSYDWSAAGAEYEFDAEYGDDMKAVLLDATHILIVYSSSIAADNSYALKVKVLAINAGTYAITTTTSETLGSAAAGTKSITNLRDNFYVIAWDGSSIDGFLKTIYVDSSTYAITKYFKNYEFDTTSGYKPKVVAIDESTIYLLYRKASNTSYASLLNVQLEHNDDNFYIEEGQNSFIRIADNGLLYWFVGEKIHTIDGSITGGLTGSITKEVLTFPSYLTTVDAVDTNGYMFIGIHSNLDASGSSDIRAFSTSPVGVYVWDRLSSVVRTRDYVPIYGVREIKRMFISYSGDVMMFCINNAKQTELRRYSNGKFVTVHKLNKNGYPPYKHSLQYAGNMVVWQSQDGKMYAWGQTEFSDSEALFKIGDISTKAITSFAPGITHVSNDLASGTPQVAALVSWSDDTTHKLSRWHINGTGTINSVAQTGHIGNIYTLVYDMPAPIHINYAHLFGLPVANDGAGNTTVIATMKVYYNKSTTAKQTFSITRKDMQDGYVYLPLNQKNVVSVSFEIEYNTTQTLGSYDLYLQRMVVEYDPEQQSKK